MRIFISVGVCAQAKKVLQVAQEELKVLNKKTHIKWSNSGNFHITLCFIGELDNNQVRIVKDLLNEIAQNHMSTSVWLEKLNGFPNRVQAKIVNVSVGVKAEFRNIRNEICNQLIKIGLLEKVGTFRPHITIGRNRRGEYIDGLSSLKVENVVWKIESIDLMESKLSAEGPKYLKLASFDLKT